MSKQERGRRRCPTGSAAGRTPPVTREPPSGGRRPSPLPEDTARQGEKNLSARHFNERPSRRHARTLPAEKYVTGFTSATPPGLSLLDLVRGAVSFLNGSQSKFL